MILIALLAAALTGTAVVHEQRASFKAPAFVESTTSRHVKRTVRVRYANGVRHESRRVETRTVRR